MFRILVIPLFLLALPVTVTHAQASAPATATSSESSVSVEKARVLSVESTQIRNIPGTDNSATYQMLSALVLSGSDEGKTVTVENDRSPLRPGDTFFLTRSGSAGADRYVMLEPDRLNALGMLLGLFVLAVILIGGWTGLRGLLALSASIMLVFYVLLPGIVAGYNPFLVAFGVSSLIVIFGSFLTHGINRTTSAAVLGLIATVVVTTFIAHAVIGALQLSGISDENTVDLSFAMHGHFDFIGLLLGAMLIGALGILYDAAIGQAVAVEELLRASPHVSPYQLFARAMRMGREHIGALVNTLAIAYVGAALPLLLLFQSYGGETFLETINREMFATEIARAIVGSLGIVLAVPLSTIAAIFFLTGFPSAEGREPELEEGGGNARFPFLATLSRMKLFSHWLVAALAIGVAAYIVPGVTITLTGAFIAAIVLGALNLFIRPALLLLALPITILTLGLFSLVINALLIMLAAALVPGFSVAGFWTALLFGLVLSVINWVFHLWSR